MSSAHENFMAGARMARQLAAECLAEAKATTENARGFRLLAEHDRHLERAEDYEMRAAWYAPKEQWKEAA